MFGVLAMRGLCWTASTRHGSARKIVVLVKLPGSGAVLLQHVSLYILYLVENSYWAMFRVTSFLGSLPFGDIFIFGVV